MAEPDPGASGRHAPPGGWRRVILPYTRERVSRTDLEEIGQRLGTLVPEIDFLPVDVARPSPRPRELAGTPALALTLNVAPVGRLLDGVEGPKYIARPVHKIAQLRRLWAARLPIPRTTLFGSGRPVVPETFGEHVMIKSTADGTARAQGIVFLRTATFDRHRARLATLFAEDIARGSPPLVQSFVPTGVRPTHVRVLCVFGHPILMYRTTARRPFDPGAAGDDVAGGEATSNALDDRERRLENDPEVATLGARAAAAFARTPVVAVDVIRSVPDGRLAVLEANMGNIAPLSSPICSGLRAELGARGVLAQFCAYDVIARQIADLASETGIRP